MPYKVLIEPKALVDIQQAINYYDNQQPGLGQRFEAVIDKHFSILSKNPFFQVRYSGVRCLPVRKFPFMIHFVLDQDNKEVFIISVFHTSKKHLPLSGE